MTWLIKIINIFVASTVISWSAEAQNKVISVGGDVTEIVYALGKGDVLAATDSTSVYPKAAQETPKVGYVRRLSAEGVLSIEPDLILISGAAGPPEVLDQIKASGVKIVAMPADYSIEGILSKVMRVSEALGAKSEGIALASKIKAEWQEAQLEVAAMGMEPSALFFATLRDGAPRAAGTETAADGVIRLLGGENVFGGQTGYKSLSLEAAVAADPDIILVMTHDAARQGGIEQVVSHPAIALTSAAKNKRVFLVDSVRAMQFSPRTPQAILELARAVNAGTQ